MPSDNALAKVTAAAAHRLNAHLRAPTADEVQLLAEAVDAGANIRTDSAYEDFLDGGALPLTWGSHSPPTGGYVEGWAAGADARRDAFYARINGGDLTALAHRILAARVAANVRKAA